MPTGCNPMQTGAFSFPLRLPANLTAALMAAGAPPHSSGVGVVATLQLRQFAPEFDWYYHECADILVVNASADVPLALLEAWAAIAGPCPSSLSFSPATYPLTYYVLQPLVLGPIGIVLLLLLTTNVIWLACRARRWAAPPITSKLATSEPQSSRQGDVQGSVAVAARPALLRRMGSEARSVWSCLSVQAAVICVAFIIAGAVLGTMPTCALRPSPGFGP